MWMVGHAGADTTAKAHHLLADSKIAAMRIMFQDQTAQRTPEYRHADGTELSKAGLDGARWRAGKMQCDKRESHAQGLVVAIQLEAMRERQLNSQIGLKLCLSKETTDWTVVIQCRIEIRRRRRPMMVAVITCVRLEREMVGTREKVQSLAKYRDAGKNTKGNEADRIPT